MFISVFVCYCVMQLTHSVLIVLLFGLSGQTTLCTSDIGEPILQCKTRIRLWELGSWTRIG